MTYILARLREASTWAGISAALIAGGYVAFGTVAALIAVVLPGGRADAS